MGILKKHLQIYCKNKSEDSLLFSGNTLVIGQQAVYMEEMEAKKILVENKIYFDENFNLINGKLTNVEIDNFGKIVVQNVNRD